MKKQDEKVKSGLTLIVYKVTRKAIYCTEPGGRKHCINNPGQFDFLKIGDVLNNVEFAKK